MRLDTLTLDTTIALVGRLATALGKPFGVRAKAQGEEFFRVLKSFSLSDVDDAVNEWIDTQRKWPAPSDLKRLVLTAIKTREAELARQHQTTPDLDRCTSCRTEYTWRTWYSARIGTVGQKSAKAFDFERADGTVVLMLPQTRLLCECRWHAQLTRLSTDELRALTLESQPDAIAEAERRAHHHQQGTLV